jgi:hypothetical protein
MSQDEPSSVVSGDNKLVFRFRRDKVVKKMIVEPEGFPVEETRSKFICAQGEIDRSPVGRAKQFPRLATFLLP